jgi:hypothetical protein
MRLQIIGNAMTGEELLARRQAELHQARERQLISEAELQRLLQKAQLDQAAATLSSLGTGLSAMASAWPKVKGFAIANTIANTAQGVMKAYADPLLWWPLNIAVAGMIAAAGAKQIATISSLSMNGTGGGSVSGGSAPSVSGSAGGGGPTSAPQQLFVQGISPGQLYSGDAVKHLADALIAFQRDGGQVVIQ